MVAAADNTVIDSIGPAPIGLQGAQQLVVHPDGTRLYCNTFGAVAVVDVNAKSIAALIPSGWAGMAAIHPDGSTLYLASGGDINGDPDPKVVLIDTATNTVAGTIAVDDVYYLAVSPDGTRLYFAGYSGDQISVLDLASHTVVETIGVGKPVDGFVVSADSSRIYVMGGVKFGVTTSSVTAINAVSGAIIGGITLPLGEEPTDIAVAPDGSSVYLTRAHGNVTRVDAATMTVSDNGAFLPAPIATLTVGAPRHPS